MTAHRFVLDAGARRSVDGRVLFAGSPLRMFRLTAAGARLIDQVAAGERIDDSTTNRALLERLVDSGAAHPVVVVEGGAAARSESTPRVTTVVPTLGTPCGLPSDRPLTVVDDGSPTVVTLSDPTITVIRRPVNGGPGVARQTGLATATTEFVAFVDADTDTSPGWFEPLLAHFDDPRVALVAPRVAPRGDGRRGGYEQWRSPLDLGDQPARIAPGTRVSYVPTAAIVARVSALRSVGGFDAALRVGEDVDLVWRLVAAGWRCRYDPSVVVSHAVRPDWRAWLAQRVHYGSSAAMLAERHPNDLAPVRASAWSAGLWGLAAAGLPVAALAVGIGSTVALADRFERAAVPDATHEAVRLAGLGHLYAGRQFADAAVRAWWPLLAVAALIGRRRRTTRRILGLVGVGYVTGTIAEWRHSPKRIRAVTAVGLRAADDMAYGIGVWRGVLQRLTVRPLLPRLNRRDRF